MINKKQSQNYLLSILLVLIGLIHFIPFYITINLSFKAKTDFSSRWLFPENVYWENFASAIENANIFTAMSNSAIITVFSIVIIIFIGGMAAYPLARNNSVLNNLIVLFTLSVMMVPPLSMLVPLVTTMSRLKLISTYLGIILVLVTFQLPISIFLYTNFIKTIPKELDEAALIDGCSRFGIFYRIILPLLKPITATATILAGVAIWNDYQFSLFLLQKKSMQVVTLSVASFFSQSSSNLGAAAATSVVGVLPVVILYVFLQKYFIRGMVDSAVKG